MDRRNLILSGMGALAAGAMALNSTDSLAAGSKAAATSGAASQLSEALSKCITASERCSSFCIGELAKGNKDFAECLRTTQEMVVMCRATLSLVNYNAKLAKKLALVCAEACEACKEACAKHKEHFAHGMHLECKECMDCCAECEKLCRQFAA